MENDLKEMMPDCIACGQDKHKFFAKKNGFSLYNCQGCGHIRIYPFSFDTKEIYEDDYFSGADKGHGYVDYDSDKEPMRPVFEKYLKIINKKGKLLDVGAATGFFADIARESGYEAHGIEISDFAAEIGRKKGLDIRTGTLSQYSAEPGLFDVITMWDVLEHFPDPDVDFQKTRELLKVGGILAINTPDSGSLYARILGKSWHLFIPPEHVNYFSRKSLKLFLEKHGFEPVLVTTIGKTFTLGYIFHILSMWTGLSFFQRLAHACHGSKWLSWIALPINLFDNMFVLARKK